MAKAPTKCRATFRRRSKMILRIFLLFVLAIVIALFCRGFLMRSRFKKDLQNERAKMEAFLQDILKAQQSAKNAAKNDAPQEIFPCAMCGVCLPEEEGVRDSAGNFFCSPLHLEAFTQKNEKR